MRAVGTLGVLSWVTCFNTPFAKCTPGNPLILWRAEINSLLSGENQTREKSFVFVFDFGVYVLNPISKPFNFS